MPIKPEDIDNKQFTTTRLRGGYVQKEVDDFLDRLRDDYAHMRDLAARVGQNVTTAVENAPSLESVQRLLDVAKTHADQLVAEARADAEATLNKARQDGGRILVEAHQEAEQIKGAAHVAAQQILDKHAEVKAALAELSVKRDHLFKWVHDALERFEGGDGGTP